MKEVVWWGQWKGEGRVGQRVRAVRISMTCKILANSLMPGSQLTDVERSAERPL